MSINITVRPTDETVYWARGYMHSGQVWACVDATDRGQTVAFVAAGEEQIVEMERMVAAFQTAIAQANQARQDADLAELVSA